MRRILVVIASLMFIGGCTQTANQSGAASHIDGTKGLDTWIPVGDANWRAEDGAIVADKGKGGFLLSKKSYKDFQISAEFWVDHTTNSGIFMRITGPDPTKITAKNSYEVNIYDQRPEPKYGTGAIVDFAAVSPMPKAGGKWNTFEITAKGSQLIVLLNGIQTVNIQHAEFAQGPFALQFGNGPKDAPGGVIKWRKVQVKEL